MKDEFSLENEIKKINREFGYPSPEPVGSHYCSQCRQIHSDSKHVDKEPHWVRDSHDKLVERKI